jgi:hypothetical protein
LIDFNFNDVQNGVSFIFKNRAYNWSIRL